MIIPYKLYGIIPYYSFSNNRFLRKSGLSNKNCIYGLPNILIRKPKTTTAKKKNYDVDLIKIDKFKSRTTSGDKLLKWVLPKN